MKGRSRRDEMLRGVRGFRGGERGRKEVDVRVAFSRERRSLRRYVDIVAHTLSNRYKRVRTERVRKRETERRLNGNRELGSKWGDPRGTREDLGTGSTSSRER